MHLSRNEPNIITWVNKEAPVLLHLEEKEGKQNKNNQRQRVCLGTRFTEVHSDLVVFQLIHPPTSEAWVLLISHLPVRAPPQQN